MGDDDIAGPLGDFLAAALPLEGAEVRALRRLSGGASRQTWSLELFDAVDGSSRPLILQRLRTGTAGGSFTMEGEAALLRAAGAAGVPVAPVVAASDDASIIGAPFLVLGWVAGETIARRILRDDQFADARRALVEQSAAALAAVHRLPVSVAGHLRAGDPVDQLRGLLDVLGQPHPAFELGLRWLERHRPPAVEPVVVHGDFRLGNLMVDRDGLAAVLDWELSHLGDPIEDLGWFCVRAWRFGADLPVAGVGTYDQLLDAYRRASGRVVDPDHLRWWEALGTLKWGLICVLQCEGHRSGASRSVELAAIGRRAVENEYDLLALIGSGSWAELMVGSDRTRLEPADAVPPPTPPGLHDVPTAAELVEAVREFLETDVAEATDGRVRFHAQVAARVLAMVGRELDDGPAPVTDHALALAELGFADDAALAAAIRTVGPGAPIPERWARLTWDAVLAKLRVANPSYLRPGEVGAGP